MRRRFSNPCEVLSRRSAFRQRYCQSRSTSLETRSSNSKMISFGNLARQYESGISHPKASSMPSRSSSLSRYSMIMYWISRGIIICRCEGRWNVFRPVFLLGLDRRRWIARSMISRSSKTFTGSRGRYADSQPP